MEMILVRGLPGSGKSTVARGLLNTPRAAHFEADQYFMVGGVYEFDANKLHAAHSWCLRRTKEWLIGGTDHRAIVSNTFTTVKELRPYFELARELGIVPSVIACQNQFGNVHNVPLETLDRMRARFQWDISTLFE
jgi:tRNA uridine 5-carbamoylmethylation protein Kti12